MSEDVFRAVVRAIEAGERAALVTIVATGGSTPQRVGAKMLVYEDGRTVGTIGGGCYENDAAGKAREAIRVRQPQLVHYALNDDLAADSGSSAEVRWTSTSSRSSRLPISTSSAPATWWRSRASRRRPASASTSSTTGRSSPTPSAFRTRR